METVYVYAKRKEEYLEYNWDKRFVRINDFEQLDKSQTCLIVIMSQLEAFEIKWIKDHTNHYFFVFVGVRDKIDDDNIMPFNDYNSLLRHINQIEKQLEQKHLKAYIDQLPCFTESDHLALESILGHPLAAHKRKRQRREKKHIKGIVTLITEGDEAMRLSKRCAQKIGGRVILVDCNLLCPSVDVFFGIKKITTKVESHLPEEDRTGINVILDAIQKKLPLDGYIRQIVHPINDHLDVLLGNYNLFNYEHYELSVFEQMFDYLKQTYDLVILNTSLNLYDQLMILSLYQSDLNIFIESNALQRVRYCYSAKGILEDKQQIQPDKNVFVFRKDTKGYEGYRHASLSMLFDKQYGGIFNASYHTKLILRRLS